MMCIVDVFHPINGHSEVVGESMIEKKDSKFIHDKTEVVVEPHRGCDFRTVMKYAKLVG